MNQSQQPVVTESSGNVYADLGFDEPELQLAKAGLVRQIATIIRENGWTQEEAASRIGLDQPKVSALLRGQFQHYSTDRLFRILTRLQQDIEIFVSPAAPMHAGGRIAVHRGAERVATMTDDSTKSGVRP